MKLNATYLVLGLTTLSLVACDPIPRRTLSTDEKIADLYWIYSQFGENYAPLEYKEQRYGFNFTQLKDAYIEKAKQTKTNDEFYDLMFQLVSEFKDAHTSAALTNSSLPDRAKVAFLGFSGYRQADTLIVKKLLPTISKDSAYPIVEGDVITKLNGKALKEVIKSEQVMYRDLGQEEANYTYHMNKLFTRVSTANGLPKEKDAVLTVLRDEKEIEITLPWVVKDLYQFQAEQEKAAAPKTGGVAPAETDENAGNFLMVAGDRSTLFKFNFIGFDGRIEKPLDTLKKIMSTAGRHFAEGFRFVDNIAEWSPVAVEKEAAESEKNKTPLELLAKSRLVLDDAIYLSESKTYPAYISAQVVKNADGEDTNEKKLVGYILVDTFSPNGNTDTVLAEFKNTLKAMQNLGVKDLIIDTINNGGGSLVLGMKMAQALSNKKIEMPKMQFRLSDTWMDEFESTALEGESDAEKEYAHRMLVEMTAQKQAGKRLSEPYSAEILAPFSFKPNKDLKQSFNTVVLVNEMCASMCDIFAGMVQDNKMATIVGNRSMGAGGNVVNHQQAPNSHIDVRQTESLMVRKDGSYIENNGVTPDVEINTFEYAKKKYDKVIEKAVSVLINQKKAKPAPAATTTTPVLTQN